MGCEYGSRWRKWDFHVHTPYSALNNGYGIDVASEEDFDSFVHELFSRAIDKGVCAIGITDYFSIDGYKRIKQDYLNDPAKLIALFPNEEQRAVIEDIYIFPNIEFRIDTFVGEKQHALNYHVLFSGEVPIEAIESDFLGKLRIEFAPGDKRTLNRRNIELLGADIKAKNDCAGDDYQVGLKHVTVKREEIRDALRDSAEFKNAYMITVPVDEDLSSVDWKGRDYPTRKNIYCDCHCYLTSNEGTAKWALAEGEEKERIAEFGSIKPCIWGSDSHSFERMFEPDLRRYCWIKGDNSFEGLRQILFEPATRVSIGEHKPDEKSPHKIIESIAFDDANFQLKPIVFNENLTCIIGGKSTGKSMLLRKLAESIDPEYAKRQEKSASMGPTMPVKDATVTWGDGASGPRKIIYIPQTYLNRIVDNPEKETEINEIVEGVLTQDIGRRKAREVLSLDVESIVRDTRDLIDRYCTTRNRAKELSETISAHGTSEQFERTIEQLETERKDLAAKASLTEEDLARFSELEQLLGKEVAAAKTSQEDLAFLETLGYPTLVFPSRFSPDGQGGALHDFGAITQRTSEKLQQELNRMTDRAREEWDKTIGILEESLRKEHDDAEAKIRDLESEQKPLRGKIDCSEQLKKLTVRITAEREGLEKAIALEGERNRLENEARNAKQLAIASQERLLERYSRYCTGIKQASFEGTDLEFSAETVWRKEDFTSRLLANVDNRGISSYRSKEGFDLSDLKPDEYGERLLCSIWDAIEHPDEYGGLALKGSSSLQGTLTAILDDWYNVHYIVKSGNDTIDAMSPGKKGLVLLELLIGLDEDKCPILIDQPEDDLDNRSVYKDLAAYLSRRKSERQIIVVTHNANVVLGADAEEVIIANQEGADSKNEERRFEYRSGAIENNDIEKNEDGSPRPGVLNEKGLQDQMCDILEGGQEAFAKRQGKYTSSLEQLQLME